MSAIIRRLSFGVMQTYEMISYLANVATENLMKFTTLFDILPPIPKFDDHSSLPRQDTTFGQVGF